MPLKKFSVFVPPHETPFVLQRLVGDILNVFTGEHINLFSNSGIYDTESSYVTNSLVQSLATSEQSSLSISSICILLQ